MSPPSPLLSLFRGARDFSFILNSYTPCWNQSLPSMLHVSYAPPCLLPTRALSHCASLALFWNQVFFASLNVYLAFPRVIVDFLWTVSCPEESHFEDKLFLCWNRKRNSHWKYFMLFIVWHPTSLSKLSAYGIQSQLHTWLSDFLYSPIQCVALSGILSSPLRVKIGVPQDSVLGPVL